MYICTLNLDEYKISKFYLTDANYASFHSMFLLEKKKERRKLFNLNAYTKIYWFNQSWVIKLIYNIINQDKVFLQKYICNKNILIIV